MNVLAKPPPAAASGLPTGQRMHKPMVIHRAELQRAGDSFTAAPALAGQTSAEASGQATGKRTHKPVVLSGSYD
ncbi:MAG: hypothetical protein JNK82_41695 [Myxococcaceae bacterium]|nr:hypothetical protein [Myxococcaceae bacterium]